MSIFADVMHASRADVYIDITPLLDVQWTGIPVVAAQLSRQFLNAAPESTHFFFEDFLLEKSAVVDALSRNSGLYLHRDYFHGASKIGPLKIIDRDRVSVGFFPSVKRVRGYFDLEFSVVHDLSTLITPQFHTVANICHHMDTLAPDLNSNNVTFCVSRATYDDLNSYIGVPHDCMEIMYNGVSWPDLFAARYEAEVDEAAVEPFITILGTREPRKNIQKVYDMLELFPEILDEYRFVFVGKIGWLSEQTSLPDPLRRALNARRIHFTGFVSEYEKYKLLRAAQASIYPSLFEGFGLPVLESMSVGTPCICSYSSSLPEVGVDSTIYFDPLSASDMYDAILRFRHLTAAERVAMSARCVAISQQFSWERSFESVAKRISPLIESRYRSKVVNDADR